MGIRIGKYWFHRKEQYDLDVFPLICVHKVTPNKTSRVFCLAIKDGKLKAW